MTELGLHWERESIGGGHSRLTLWQKRIAYHDDNGNLRRNVSDWRDSGIPGRPHMVTDAPFIISAGNDGMRRIHPTRELDRYFEIGAPYVKVGGTWQQVNLGAPTRTGNLLQWTKPKANMYVRMAGHYIKLAILLKSGWVPEDHLIAFPVGLTGLTRNGGQVLADGVPVMRMNAPHVEDYDNPMDVRPVAHEFVKVGGQWHVLLTLPDLTGMSRPHIDPTLSLQPGAAAGTDTVIYASFPTTNYGTNTVLAIGDYTAGGAIRTLIKFDLSSLPDAAIISSATLSLYATLDDSLNARTARVFRQKRAWVESQATWNIYSTGNNWQTAGAFGPNDCEQSDIGNRPYTATETLNEFKDFPLTPTTKAALDAGDGWLIKMDVEASDAYEHASSDHGTAAQRPKLVLVYYVIPRHPATIFQIPAIV